jgi:ribosomal protein S19E (S16A)
MRKSHPGILESRLRTVLQNSMNKLEKDGIVQLNKDGQSLTAVGSEIFDLLD